MYEKVIRVLAGLIGAALLLTGLRWLTDPAAAAENLYMPLLDGAARSTQVGDLTAFFVTGGILALAGVFTRNAALLIAPALLVGLAALFRTLAWLLHGAELTVDLIAVEVAMCVVLVMAWAQLRTRVAGA